MTDMTRWIFAAAALLSALPVFGTNWTDRGEYDLVLTIRAEASPQKRIQMLDQWKQKYPKTDVRQMRRELYLAAYESLGDNTRMLATAREMIGEEPDNFVGLYWFTVLAPTAKDSNAELQGQAEKSASRLLSGLPSHFSADKKPSWMKEDEWKNQRGGVEHLAHRTLGWTSWQKENYPAAEQEFTKCLQQQPDDAEIWSWLGIVLALQKEPEKRVAGLWHLARASSKRDKGVLPETQRRQVTSIFERAYTSYHGSAEGMDNLRNSAVAAVFPPAGFSVESGEVIAARRAEEELNRTNPELAAWLRLRKRLDSADGEAYFKDSVQSKALPKLKGTLVRFSPAKRPNELVIGLSDPAAEEIVIKLATRLPNDAEPGTVLTFEGNADSFNKNPFLLTVTAGPDKIEGWPAPAGRPRK